MTALLMAALLVLPSPSPPVIPPLDQDHVERTSCLWMGTWICPEGIDPPRWPS